MPDTVSVIPRSRELADSGLNQRRWMSLPHSRLVVNPYDFYSPLNPAQYSSAPNLPVNIGYYAAGQAYELADLLTVYRDTGVEEPAVQTIFQDDFSGPSLDWVTPESLRATVQNGQVRLTVTGNAEAVCISRWVEADLDSAPYLELDIESVAGSWGVKLNDGSAIDLALQRDTRQTGRFTFDIPRLTGWHGKKGFFIKIYAVGKGQPVEVNYVRLFGLKGRYQQATTFTTTWMPHELTFTADYANGLRVSGTDFLADTDALVRRLEVTGGDMENPIALAGRYKGDVEWDANRNVLVIELPSYTYAIAFSQPVGPDLQLHNSLPDFLATAKNLAEPSRSGIWALHANLKQGHPLDISIGFSTMLEGRAVAVERALRTLQPGVVSTLHAEREQYWDDYLARVPKVQNFTLSSVPTYGVTAAEIKKAYYTAWVFVAANVLPVMPETGYMYPQLAAGKPSLWAEGAPIARPSASWESFFGMQLYAFMDPDTAWAVFKGMMSLVDEKGFLGGESLPSRKAQTAALLYERTGDTASLRQIYPALKRYLLWRRANPRWIFGAYNYPEQMDADFVVSAIVDMGYAGKIASVLGMPDEAAFWQKEQKDFFADYLHWFWPNSSATPSQIYNLRTEERGWGNSLWVASGLHLGLLEGTYLTGMLQRFRGTYNPVGTFNSFAVPKYPEWSFTVYGLLERGLFTEADVMINTGIRDVTRAHMFAEQYTIDEFPRPNGVRPSFFGCALLIDMLWLKNGYMYDPGTSHRVDIPGESGSVEVAPGKADLIAGTGWGAA